MKRFILILAAAALAASTSGCGGSAPRAAQPQHTESAATQAASAPQECPSGPYTACAIQSERPGGPREWTQEEKDIVETSALKAGFTPKQSKCILFVATSHFANEEVWHEDEGYQQLATEECPG